MGELVKVDFARGADLTLNKVRLAAVLGKSKRWVDMRLHEGMPSSLDRRGRRMFSLHEVNAWLADHGTSKGTSPVESPEPAPTEPQTEPEPNAASDKPPEDPDPLSA